VLEVRLLPSGLNRNKGICREPEPGRLEENGGGSSGRFCIYALGFHRTIPTECVKTEPKNYYFVIVVAFLYLL
jgi:hypothetical protein